MTLLDTFYRVGAPEGPRPAASPLIFPFLSSQNLDVLDLQTFMRRNSVYMGVIVVGAFVGDRVSALHAAPGAPT
jgi:hypothetical protein